MTIILCAINAETGEVLNRDGSVAGKVVPTFLKVDQMHAYVEASGEDFDKRYAAVLAASRVDLSGCEVKVPALMHVPGFRDEDLPLYESANNAAIQSIKDQMPQVKK